MHFLCAMRVFFVPNFVSFVTSTAELAHEEKSHNQSLNHPDDGPGIKVQAGILQCRSAQSALKAITKFHMHAQSHIHSTQVVHSTNNTEQQ